MKITMLKNERGSDQHPDGIQMPTKMYHEGKTYEVGESLGGVFVEMGVAKQEDDDVPTSESQAADAVAAAADGEGKPVAAKKAKAKGKGKGKGARSKKDAGAAPENKEA